MKELVVQMRDINYFILTHYLSKMIFGRYSNIKLLKMADTRFASNIYARM